MPQEIEIKLRVTDSVALSKALRGLGARAVRCVHERNELYDSLRGDLKRSGELFRLRIEVPQNSARRPPGLSARKTILTLKAPIRVRGRVSNRGGKYKVKEEIEAEVTDGPATKTILRRLGLRIWFRYEKRRTTFRLPASLRWACDLFIELDETPIGSFVELEGPRKAIDRAAKALGYSKADYVTANYFALYRNHCRRTGKKPGDMLFTNDQRTPGLE